MSVRVGVVMDPIEQITFYKDTTLALLLAAQARGWQLFYMLPTDLYLDSGDAMATMRPLTVFDDAARWFALGEASQQPMADLDVVLVQ